MRSLSPRVRPDPGPSKLAYRLSRAWAQQRVRAAVQVYLPLTLAGAALWGVVSTDRLRLALAAEAEALVERFAARPEFVVRGVEIAGASAGLAAQVQAVLGPVTGLSSLHLDLDALRRGIERLGAVAAATVYFDPSGRLIVRVAERVAEALWRDPDGALWLIDGTGVVIGPAGPRAAHPRLPVLLGLGAPARVAEALALLGAAPDLAPRVRALARMGERRWDIVLDRGITLRLPEDEPERALSGVMALHYGERLFERDLAVVDLRLPGQPVLRLTPRAAEEAVLRRAALLLMGEDI